MTRTTAWQHAGILAAMDHADSNVALMIALALASGVVSQALARHLRLPGIVVLLACGMILGPDGVGLIRPAEFGGALTAIVGFAVAVILFEGGMNLELRRLRKQSQVVRRLVTGGALLTMVGGALSARLILGWDWRLSILFGALVIVTGPTVVTPLLRRVRVTAAVQTVLEAEGVLIDAVGAVTAVVVLEILVHPTLESTAVGAGGFLMRFVVGGLLGLLVGYGIAWALRQPRLVPEGLENVFALAVVLAAYQVGDAAVPEAGIVAVTLAGIVVGNLRARVTSDLAAFKEQLTVMLIGLLFILLAADVRLASVVGLGWRGIGVVAALAFIVRPIQAWLCTIGSDLQRNERLFISWVAPRGIVAAAVASLFATSLDRNGIDGGADLRALVFLVIAGTVVVQGLSMGVVARALGLRRATGAGYVILGANGLGLAVAGALRSSGIDVVMMESNDQRANDARQAGYQVVFGNALEGSVMRRAQPDTRTGALAVTPNEEANLLFARRVVDEFECPRSWVALDRIRGHLTTEFIRESDVGVLFGHHRDLVQWSLWLERGRAEVSAWSLERVIEAVSDPESSAPLPTQQPAREPFVPLVHGTDSGVVPYDDATVPAVGDVVFFAIDTQAQDDAVERLRSAGYAPAAPSRAATD